MDQTVVIAQTICREQAECRKKSERNTRPGLVLLSGSWFFRGSLRFRSPVLQPVLN